MGFKNSHAALLVAALALCLFTFASLAGRRARAQGGPTAAADMPALALSSPVSGLSSPVGIANAGDGSGRLFVVEQAGRVRIIKNGALLPAPFLDITSRVSFGGERGLLGLAFPPGFATKKHFYVYYTNLNGDIVIARYQVSAGSADAADASSQQIVITVPHPTNSNHNGGQMAFGPDGFLYAGTGDGGAGGDPPNNAQNTNVLLGKLLRLDVETNNPQTYNVPSSNPFVGRTGFRPEIWAYGLRNPWRFSFDRQTGDLYIGDVGQDLFEEIDFQNVGSAGGQNYGWRIMEGLHCYNASTCNTTGLTLPVLEYDHSLGCAVVGGYVYRGTQFPRMQGLYFYGDFCSGRLWSLKQQSGVWQNTQLLNTGLSLSAFGEDEAGNVYVASYSTGEVYKLTDTSPTPTPTPTPSTNPIDGSEFFVRQHYLDFLNREPDPDGLNFWTSGIDSCNGNAPCIEVKRIDTSAAFFLSIEFQETGYLVERIYKVAFGDINPPAVPVPVRFAQFLHDTQEIGSGVVVGQTGWEAKLEQNKQAYAADFVSRANFLARYPASQTSADYVASLNANAGSALTQAEADDLAARLAAGTETRATVLRKIAENDRFRAAELNRAFVLMEYFGYLRRDPDSAPDADFTGYNFWLSKLDQFNGDFQAAEMVRAFINSIEYRKRFGP